MRRAILAIACFLGVGLLITLGPYADLKTRLAPRTPFEEQPARDADDAREVLEKLGPGGRALFRRHLALDSLVIVGNATWLWIWLRATARRTLPRKLAAALPAGLALLPALADAAEDVFLSRCIAAFPEVSESAVLAAGSATVAKLAAFTLAIVVAITLSVWLGVKRLRARRTRRAPGSPANTGSIRSSDA